jgi:DnaJ like chaperone protein
MKYHPDKVSHLGDEFKQVAEEKMKEINSAYDFFKRKFNG